jgi:pimeloyl-ACP methyl ester carboxylesterase
MGGILSVLAGGQQPERVAGVVNLDGALPMSATARSRYEELFALIKHRGFHPVVPRFLRETFFLAHERGSVCDAIVADMLSLPETLALALARQFTTLDGEKALSNCPVPMLFVGGSHPRFDEEILLRSRPGAWVGRAAVSGHFLQIFSLPQVIAMIEKFLECEKGPVEAGPDIR